MAFHALADYQNHVIGWLQWEQSALGDGAVVRFPRIWMSSGECRPKALHLDRRSRQNHRRRQKRASSVRFDPLGTTGPGESREDEGIYILFTQRTTRLLSGCTPIWQYFGAMAVSMDGSIGKFWQVGKSMLRSPNGWSLPGYSCYWPVQIFSLQTTAWNEKWGEPWNAIARGRREWFPLS